MILQFLINAAYHGFKAAYDNDVVKEMQDVINAAFDFDMPGKDKKAAVMAELREVGGVIGEAIAEMANFFLSSMVDIFVAKAKIDSGETLLKS